MDIKETPPWQFVYIILIKYDKNDIYTINQETWRHHNHFGVDVVFFIYLLQTKQITKIATNA
jgi:hypothetical protein